MHHDPQRAQPDGSCSAIGGVSTSGPQAVAEHGQILRNGGSLPAAAVHDGLRATGTMDLPDTQPRGVGKTPSPQDELVLLDQCTAVLARAMDRLMTTDAARSLNVPDSEGALASTRRLGGVLPIM